jgi:FtsP/CotA-like multicopper oxidase with cupredoxin domain
VSNETSTTHRIRDGLKGNSDVTIEDSPAGRMAGLIGRRKFLVFGGAGAAVLVGGAGVATAIVQAGGPDPTPRSLAPVGLDPATGRDPLAVSEAPLGVRHFAVAGTDGWVSMPNAANTFVGNGKGAAAIDPYFPDPLADPGNTTTYAFCFRNVTGLTQAQVAAQKGRTQICAPIFYSTVGEEIWVTLTNLGLSLRPDLVDSHTLHWHGFRNAIPFYDGVPESSISVPIGRDFTYVYRPKDAGTYMYHCHFEDVEHVTMGMHGIVFVKPSPSDRLAVVGPRTPTGALTGRQGKAYGVADGDTTGESYYDREYAIMLSEVDTRAHFGDAHIQATDWTDFHADFWTMNGRAYPDTLEPNGVRDAEGQLRAQRSLGINGDGTAHLQTIADYTTDESRLFSNPLSSLVQCAPGERILIRFANLGFLDHSFVFPGLEVDVLGRDARFVPDSAQRKATDSIQIGPGESRDVFFTAPAAGSYAFYDRGLSHYTGSADGADAWVGGQRSEVRVIAGLAPQLKPNGWAGEPEWAGEFPLVAAHTKPVVTLTGTKVTALPVSDQGTFLNGTVTVDYVDNPGTYLASLWWVQAASAPSPGDAAWHSAVFTAGRPNTYHVLVAGPTAAPAKYWVLARDSAGVYSTPQSVTV